MPLPSPARGARGRRWALPPWCCLLYTSRSALVPIVQFSSNLVSIVLIIGIILLAMGGSPWVLGLGLGLFAMTTIFASVSYTHLDVYKRQAWGSARVRRG